MGSISRFSRALSASKWGHSSQIKVLTSIWGRRKGCDNETFRAVFLSQPLVILGPPKYCKLGGSPPKKDKSTLSSPPPKVCAGLSGEALLQSQEKHHQVADLCHFFLCCVPGFLSSIASLVCGTLALRVF